MVANPIVGGESEFVPLLRCDRTRHVSLRVVDDVANNLVRGIVFVIQQFLRDAFDQHHIERTSTDGSGAMRAGAYLQHVGAAGYAEAVFEVADLIGHGSIIVDCNKSLSRMSA